MAQPLNDNRQYLKAAGFLLGSSFMIVLVNMFAKLLTENGLTPLEVLFYRNLGGFALVTLTILSTKQFQRFKTKRPKAQFIRALTGNICLWLIIWANALLPLATVSAILLSAPIIATVLSPLFLNEKTSKFRWLCVIAGLVGALVITQPGMENFTPSTIVALMGALASAIVILYLRSLGQNEDPLTTTFYLFGWGSLFAGLCLPFFWTGLPSAYALLAGIIISGFLSQFFKNNAYKHGEISFLSPLIYFNIVWATLLGWAVWKEIPEIHVYIGCAIIICSNLLITWKEQKIARNDV